MITISSGHGLKIRGAAGPEPWGLDEVDEAIRVMNEVAAQLRRHDIDVKTYTDTVSTSQDENLRRLTDWHNSIDCTLACSIHFNAYQETSKPMGTECLYVSQDELAAEVSAAITYAGDFIDRGPKKRTDLYFLNNTEAPAILLEVCFVDSKADCDLYEQNFDLICAAIAEVIAREEIQPGPTPPTPEPDALFYARGTCSWFGGPADQGVSPSEGLAFFYDPSECLHLMLPEQPPGTLGMARRLDPAVMYVACRWDYDVTPKEMLRDQTRKALVRAKGKAFAAYPADWGPHQEQTGRAADLSPALLEALGLTTDDEVEVIYPAP